MWSLAESTDETMEMRRVFRFCILSLRLCPEEWQTRSFWKVLMRGIRSMFMDRIRGYARRLTEEPIRLLKILPSTGRCRAQWYLIRQMECSFDGF